MKQIGEIIKKHMKSKNLSQSMVSRQASISESAFSEMVNGKRKISIQKLVQIAQAMDERAGDLINEANGET